MRWNLLKGYFSRKISTGERISKSRQKRRERGIWQRRFLAHLIEEQADLNWHIAYSLEPSQARACEESS